MIPPHLFYQIYLSFLDTFLFVFVIYQFKVHKRSSGTEFVVKYSNVLFIPDLGILPDSIQVGF